MGSLQHGAEVQLKRRLDARLTLQPPIFTLLLSSVCPLASRKLSCAIWGERAKLAPTLIFPNSHSFPLLFPGRSVVGPSFLVFAPVTPVLVREKEAK